MSYEISSAIIPPYTPRELRHNFPETQGVVDENNISAIHVYYFDICLGWCPR